MRTGETVASGAEVLGLALPDGACERFDRYRDLLEEKNRVMNLTAITGSEEVARLHFLDSIALLTLLDFRNLRVIDVGTGAGFPGLPLKIAEPTVKLTLLDSLGKRVDFLSETCEALGIEAECLHARAEEAALKPDMRDGFDIAVSRAVARLNVLCELCLPYVKPGGVFVSMKAVDSSDEIEDAAKAIKTLGGGAAVIRDYTIPGTDVTHRAVVIPKLTETPKGYPRRFAKIQKQPL